MEFRISVDENTKNHIACEVVSAILQQYPLEAMARENCFSIEYENETYYLRVNNETKKYKRLYVWKGK